MKVAVVDVAAESSGALSVLLDFYDYIRHYSPKGICWYFFTSVISLEDTENIRTMKSPWIKKSWVCRLIWEKLIFVRQAEKYRFDTVISLQNKALPVKNVHQIVYFHNALHFLPFKTVHPFVKMEISVFLYRVLITPYTMRSFKYCQMIVTQTNAVKTELLKNIGKKHVAVIHPDISVQPCFGENCVKGFLYPCGPVSYKNHKMIIEAVRRAGKDFRGEILFTLQGDENRYARQIKVLAEGFSNIRFIGFLPREELMKKYEDYGLIFASDVESFPIPFAEGMAYGTPVIARDLPYAREILENYENRYFYNSTGELAALLKRTGSYKRCKGNCTDEDSSWGKFLKLAVGRDFY